MSKTNLRILYAFLILIAGVVLLTGCAGTPSSGKAAATPEQAATQPRFRFLPGLVIEENPSGGEQAKARAELADFAKTLDLEPFLFVRHVRLLKTLPKKPSTGAIDLLVRESDTADMLLSRFLHAQFRRYLASKPEDTKAASIELRKTYPKTDPSEILMCWLEFQADKYLIGKDRTAAVYEKLIERKAIFEIVEKDEMELGKLVRAHGLLPPVDASNGGRARKSRAIRYAARASLTETL